MIAKPMKTLELHHPMIQFLIICFSRRENYAIALKTCPLQKCLFSQKFYYTPYLQIDLLPESHQPPVNVLPLK